MMMRLTAPFILLFSSAVAASPLPDFPFINVSGQAVLEVAPDKAQIRLVIRQTAATAEKATSAIYQQSTELLAFLKQKGITEQDLEAAQINKEALYKDYQDRTITGYEASQPVVITLNNLEHYIAVMDYLFTQPNIFSIQGSFDLHERDKYEMQLSQKAGADARRQAEQLAAVQGVRLSTVFAISDKSDWGSLAGDFGFSGNNVGYGALYKTADAESASGRGALILPKHIKLQKSVNVIYKIKP